MLPIVTRNPFISLSQKSGLLDDNNEPQRLKPKNWEVLALHHFQMTKRKL